MGSKLYTPIKIGTTEFKNRVQMAPMSTGYESPDGTISEPAAYYWEERAKGGVGMIIVDAVTIDTAVPYQTPETISLGGDEFIPGFKAFTDRIHKHGAKVFPQIAYMGAESCTWWKGVPAVGPSPYHNAAGAMCREMKLEEIPPIIKKYGEAAKRARLAGCDGIQLHCAHAYMMLGAFLSPLRNKRTDCYGGNLDNRARLTFEVIKEIKSVAGQDFPIMMRISPDERTPGGLKLDDMLYLIPQFIEAGIDAFEVSGGNPYEAFEYLIPCHYSQPGANLAEARAVKAISTVPVFTVGKITDAKFAEYVVDSGYVDGVTMGRPLLADPALVNKAREGRYEDIAPCASCGGACITRSKDDMTAHCIINPALGREKEWAIPALKGEPKKVLVVGAGPAGLSAARVAALRGHKVTLLEKNTKVGGQINLAAVPPNKIEVAKWINYLYTQCNKLGVTIKYGVEGTVENIKAEGADSVIMATGSNPLIAARIPGFDTLEKVTTSHDILAGRAQALNGRVLVLGGGLVGCETADHICQTSRGDVDVTILEMQPNLVAILTPANRKPLLRELKAHGVTIRTSTKLMEFRGRDVVVEYNGELQTLKNFDHIIWGMGARPNNALNELVKEIAPQVQFVGDCSKIGTCKNAIEDGYKAACAI